MLSPGDLPDPGSKSGSPALQADFLPAEIPGKIKNVYARMFVELENVDHINI